MDHDENDARSSTALQQGFTIIEIMITVAIIAVMTLSISSMMRASFEVRRGLSDNAMTTHRFATAMARLATDLEHAYIVPTVDTTRNGARRSMKTLFQIDVMGSSDKVGITTMSNIPTLANSSQSDATYVVYEVKESKKFPGRSDLFRGAFERVPAEFREDPPMELLARSIKRIEVRAWNGDDWSRDRWDSSRGDWRNKMPRMVRVLIEGWDEDLKDGEEQTSDEDENLVQLSTVVYLPYAAGYAELKSGTSMIKWY